MSGTVPLFEKMQAYEAEIIRLRAQIEQERTVQTRLADEVERLEALLREQALPHLKWAAGELKPEEYRRSIHDVKQAITEIEALK